MDRNKKKKLIVKVVLVSIIVQFFLTIVLEYIELVLISAIISAVVVGISNYSNYKISITPFNIKEFKKLIYSNKNYNKISNMDKIVEFFNRTEVISFFKMIFPIVAAEENPKSIFHLRLENKRFYGFYIHNNKLSLIKFNNNKFLSARDYHNRINSIVDKKHLKKFFKDLIVKSKNFGTDYIDHIVEKKKDDIYREIANMLENASYI